MSAFEAVLFDLDGTLLDTERMYAKFNQEYINLYGNKKEYTWELRKRVMGQKAIVANQLIVEMFEINKSYKDLMEYKSKRTRESLNEIKAFPKVKEILQYFKSKGMKIAIATSSTREWYDVKMENFTRE